MAPVISRRGFVRAGLAGAVVLGGAAVIGRQLRGYAVDPATAARLRVLSPKEYLVMQAVARRVLAPDAADAPSADAVDTALAVDAYVAKLPRSIQQEIAALLQLVEHGSGWLRLRASRFTRMTAAEQDATLRDWESSSLTLRRRGFQGLRTLAFVGYWRDDRTWSVIGYTGPMLPQPSRAP